MHINAPDTKSVRFRNRSGGKILTIGDGGGSLELIKNGGDLNEGLVGLFSFFVLLVSFNHCACINKTSL